MDTAFHANFISWRGFVKMAMQTARLNGTLQENLIALLAHSDKHGKLIAGMIAPDQFEGDYRIIAERCMEYWRVHRQAPKMHTADLFDDILEDKNNRRANTYRRILTAMMALDGQINIDYVISKLTAFTRMQSLKSAILKSSEQLQAKQETALPEIEKIWHDLLKTNVATFEPGSRLGDVSSFIEYMETQYGEFLLGIPELDRMQIVPSRGTVLIFLAPAKRGKTWFLINVGRTIAVVNRKKVVHISLEMSEEQVKQRYYQSLFGATKRKGSIINRRLEKDDDGRLAAIEDEEVEPDFYLNNRREIENELNVHLSSLGSRINNVIIKRFPPRTLTTETLDAYLDNLEATEGFIPDAIILDYIGIMKTDPRNHRITLGRVLEDFRAVCVRRNVAGVTAHQISKAGAESASTSSTHVAEDWSMIGTADIILVYAATDAERKLGLGRLRVTNARDSEDGFGVLLSQNYASGQFIIDSVRLDNDYFDMLKDLAARNDVETDSEYEEEGDDE